MNRTSDKEFVTKEIKGIYFIHHHYAKGMLQTRAA